MLQDVTGLLHTTIGMPAIIFFLQPSYFGRALLFSRKREPLPREVRSAVGRGPETASSGGADYSAAPREKYYSNLQYNNYKRARPIE